MHSIRDLLMNPLHAKWIGLTMGVLMALLFLSPINLVGFYLFVRPLIQPYAYQKYTLFANVPLTAILSIILIIAAYINGLLRADQSLRQIRLWPLYALLFFSSLSFYNTPSILQSAGGLLKLITAMAMYILVCNSVRNETDAKKILWFYVLSTIIPMLFGYYQYATGTGHAWKAEYYAGTRIDSFLGEWNAYGEFLCLGIAAGLVLLNMQTSKRSRVLLFTIMASLIVSLILSLNRGSWISLGLGVLVASLVFWRKVSIKWLVVIALTILVGFGGMIVGRFNELEQTNALGRSKNTFEGRVDGWQSLVPIIEEHPLIGHGVESSYFITDERFHEGFVPHNDYVRMALEIGVPGALIYFLFLIGEVFSAFLRRQTSNWALNYALIVITIYIVVLSLVQNLFTNVIIFPMFMGLLAIGHSAVRFKKPKETIKIDTQHLQSSS